MLFVLGQCLDPSFDVFLTVLLILKITDGKRRVLFVVIGVDFEGMSDLVNKDLVRQ